MFFRMPLKPFKDGVACSTLVRLFQALVSLKSLAVLTEQRTLKAAQKLDFVRECFHGRKPSSTGGDELVSVAEQLANGQGDFKGIWMENGQLNHRVYNGPYAQLITRTSITAQIIKKGTASGSSPIQDRTIMSLGLSCVRELKKINAMAETVTRRSGESDAEFCDRVHQLAYEHETSKMQISVP